MKWTNSSKYTTYQEWIMAGGTLQTRKTEQTCNWKGDWISNQKPCNKHKANTRWLCWWIFPNIWRINTHLPQTVPNIEEGTLPNSYYKANITLMLKPDKNTTKKSKIPTDIPDEYWWKILANRIQQHVKRIIHHDQMGFIPGMQGWFTYKN